MSSTKSLYAPIDHTVIDSPAFADLSGQAVRLLTIVARQWDGYNNGRLHASYSYCRQRGIGSPKTLQDALSSLIAHGLLYRTRCHGFIEGKNIPATYALTWRPLTKNRKGLWCDGFVMNAYKRWEPENSDPQKVQHTYGKKCSLSLKIGQAGRLAKTVFSMSGGDSVETTETETYELLAIKEGVAGRDTLASVADTRDIIVKKLLSTCRSNLRGKVWAFRQLAESSKRYAYKPVHLAAAAQG